MTRTVHAPEPQTLMLHLRATRGPNCGLNSNPNNLQCKLAREGNVCETSGSNCPGRRSRSARAKAARGMAKAVATTMITAKAKRRTLCQTQFTPRKRFRGVLHGRSQV